MLQNAVDANVTWLLVAGHYPVYAQGEHGDTKELMTTLLPLLREFRVDAYLAGHDHISQHLR
jgi:tartrate-resistant acid phosphatase type 5